MNRRIFLARIAALIGASTLPAQRFVAPADRAANAVRSLGYRVSAAPSLDRPDLPPVDAALRANPVVYNAWQRTSEALHDGGEVLVGWIFRDGTVRLEPFR